MSLIQIPIRSDLPAYEFSIELDGLIYNFTFRWNDRCGRWHFDIAKEDGTVVIAGVPVMVRWPVLARYRSADLPPGTILFVDLDDTKLDPEEDDLGTRVVMLYDEAD